MAYMGDMVIKILKGKNNFSYFVNLFNKTIMQLFTYYQHEQAVRTAYLPNKMHLRKVQEMKTMYVMKSIE